MLFFGAFVSFVDGLPVMFVEFAPERADSDDCN